MKKKFFLLIPFSFLFFSLKGIMGMLFGFFVAKILSQKLPSLLFEFENFKIHLHHWILGSLLLILSFNSLPLFYRGFLGGIIFEGIYNYPDWYKILIRKN